MRKISEDIGREEMNLAEFPLGLLTERVPKGLKSKTLVFEGEHGKLTVSGSDAYGLPGPFDVDVLVGLMALTKSKNNFTDPTVPFSRYELLQVLRRQDKGQGYRRIDESLNLWVGVSFFYEKSFWNNSIKCRVDAKFHLLECVVTFDREVRRKLQSRRESLPSSSFTWNKIFFASCQANNLKRLDLAVYFGLRSAISKQLYRFLDKRFYLKRELVFDLRQFAFGHAGLSTNYADFKIKEKLKPALEELEAIGYLEPATPSERYLKQSRGGWRIRLVRATGRTNLAGKNPIGRPEQGSCSFTVGALPLFDQVEHS